MSDAPSSPRGSGVSRPGNNKDKTSDQVVGRTEVKVLEKEEEMRGHRMYRIRTVLVLALLCNGTGQCFASKWLAWSSGFASGVTVAGLAASGIGLPLAAAGGAAEVVGIVGVCAGIDDFQPSIALLPPAPLFNGCPANAVYQPLPLPGNQYDTLTKDVNIAIADLNKLIADFNGGASQGQLNTDAQAIGQALSVAASAYDRVGPPFSVTQSQLNSALAQIETSGLPAGEVSFLQNAGWSQAQISSLQQYVGGLTLNLSVSSASLSEAFHLVADELLSAGAQASPTLPQWATIVMALGLISFSVRQIRRQRYGRTI